MSKTGLKEAYGRGLKQGLKEGLQKERLQKEL